MYIFLYPEFDFFDMKKFSIFYKKFEIFISRIRFLYIKK